MSALTTLPGRDGMRHRAVDIVLAGVGAAFSAAHRRAFSRLPVPGC